jgi:hypothetical protein
MEQNTNKKKRGNAQNLIPYKPGQSGNPKGRPKRAVSYLTGKGYKLTEINDTIQEMVGMNIAELKKVRESDNATILEKTIAEALKKGLEKGNLESIETLLNRVYGKPKQDYDITTAGDKLDNKPRIEIQIIKGSDDKNN